MKSRGIKVGVKRKESGRKEAEFNEGGEEKKGQSD